MSLADEFVKRLAAVKCDHDPGPESEPFGYPADIVIAGTGEVIKADRRSYAIRAKEWREASEARCIYCIARRVLEDEKAEILARENWRCDVCGSTSYGSHIGHWHR